MTATRPSGLGFQPRRNSAFARQAGNRARICRPYRRRRTREEAIRILEQGAGKQWDAVLVDQFLRLVGETGADTVPQARSAV